MSQRRMPSGQGPARGAARPPAASGPRAAGQRSRYRHTGERGARPDQHGPPSNATWTDDGRLDQGAPGQSGSSDHAGSGRPERTGRGRAGTARIGNYRGNRRGGPDRGGIRRAAGPARRTRAPRRPRRISGRAAVLGALLIALAFAYAYPVRVYLEQQAQINALRTSQQQQRQRIQHLTDALAQWNDDDFVIAQARTRFQLVRKGELLYMVVDPTATETGAQDHATPWFDQLRANLHEIDSPSAG